MPAVYQIVFDASNVREVSYRLASGPTGATTVLQTSVSVIKNAARVDHALTPVSAEVMYITIKPATATDLTMTVSNLQIHACLEAGKSIFECLDIYLQYEI